jgi:hypothetical protein
VNVRLYIAGARGTVRRMFPLVEEWENSSAKSEYRSRIVVVPGLGSSVPFSSAVNGISMSDSSKSSTCVMRDTSGLKPPLENEELSDRRLIPHCRIRFA